MALVFLMFAVLVVAVCLIMGFVPDPLVMMGKVRRDREPRRFYLYLGFYLLLGAALSVGSWVAGDRYKNAPTKAPFTQQQRVDRWYEDWSARQPRPTAQLVDHIEALLVREPCIGDLKRWSRSFAYDMLPEKTVDKGIVDFHLEEAGAGRRKAGRQISAPFLPNLDDSQIKMADGDYDLKEDRVRVGFCGNNVGASEGDADKTRRYWADLDRRRAMHKAKSR